MSGGTPSLARSRPTVVRTVVVNGSAASSHPAPAAPRQARVARQRPQALQQGELLRGEQRRRLARNAARWLGSRVTSPRRRMGSRAGVDRRARARTRATSSRSRTVSAGSRRRRGRDRLPGLDGAGRGQHDHPALAAVGDQLAARLVAVDVGQIQSGHHVVAGDRRAAQGVGAVEGDVDRHALAPQARADGFGQVLVILSTSTRMIPSSSRTPGRPGSFLVKDASRYVTTRSQIL